MAVTDKARAAAMPDVPTSAEVGLPDLLSGVWYAMVGPPKLKLDLQDQIAKATIEVLKTLMEPEVGHGETEVYPRVQA